MKNNIFQFFVLFLLIGFSFYYTEKAVMIARNNDPIMMKINSAKKDLKVNKIEPSITNNEYIPGLNGCVVDEEISYSKMKEIGMFDSNLLVFKEDKIKQNNDGKYIISGNSLNRNISIIILVKSNDDLYNIEKINEKNFKTNYFIDGMILEKNMLYVKNIISNNRIYNLGRNGKYNNKNIIYDNNLIETISNNNSNYCLSNEKNDTYLKLCNNYSMKMIKNNYINNNIYERTKQELSNGKIFIFDDVSKNIDEIIISMNYIKSRGYEIVFLDELLSESNNCSF